MKHLISLFALTALSLSSAVASADIIMNFDVNILQTTANVGDTINWELFARVTGTPNGGLTNFGIAQASVNLRDSLNETLLPGAVGSAFSTYDGRSGGIPDPPELSLIGAFDFQQDAGTAGAGVNPASVLLASGQYTLTQAGIHTLSATPSGDTNQFFSLAGQLGFSAPNYDNVIYGFDSITVAGVPEPSSLILAGAAFGAWTMRRRRAAKHSAPV